MFLIFFLRDMNDSAGENEQINMSLPHSVGKQFPSRISVAEGGGKAVLTIHANLIMISMMSCKFGEGIFGHQCAVELYCH